MARRVAVLGRGPQRRRRVRPRGLRSEKEPLDRERRGAARGQRDGRRDAVQRDAEEEGDAAGDRGDERARGAAHRPRREGRGERRVNERARRWKEAREVSDDASAR